MPWLEVSERWTRVAPEGGDPLNWPGAAEFALLHGEGRWTVFAEDPLLVLEGFDPPDLRFERWGDLPPILPDFIGFAGYEAGTDRAYPWPFPRVRFALHRRVRLVDAVRGEAWEGRREGPPSLGLVHGLGAGPFRAEKAWDSDGPAAYADKVEAVRQAIRRGEVYQANLCRQEAWTFRGDPRDLARRLRALNPAPHSALLAGDGWAVLSTSPERLVRIQDGRMESRPIKGTAPRGADPAEDRRLADGLLASAKDRAELAMIVDLVRNDLARACLLPSVWVEAFPVLESNASVHHLVASVSGAPRPDLDQLGLFAALFPAGSITGCPKLAAMDLLRGLEAHPRLASTGALGWFRHDLGQADLAVAIRTLSLGPGELRLGLGGGIIWDSEPEAEYLETVHKGRTLVRCLSS